jgi:predicted lipid-binding transport protein (Tim44 family)
MGRTEDMMPIRPAATLGPPDAGVSTYSIAAAFPSPESARMAADSLARIPIPADRIALAPPEDGLARQLPGPYNFEERREVNSSVAAGAVLGAIIGGVGALVLAGLMGGLVGGDLSALTLLCIMVFGAVGVGAIGGFLGGSTSQQPESNEPSQAWPRVSAQCEGDDEASAAIRVLSECGAVELYRDEERLV